MIPRVVSVLRSLSLRFVLCLFSLWTPHLNTAWRFFPPAQAECALKVFLSLCVFVFVIFFPPFEWNNESVSLAPEWSHSSSSFCSWEQVNFRNTRLQVGSFSFIFFGFLLNAKMFLWRFFLVSLCTTKPFSSSLMRAKQDTKVNGAVVPQRRENGKSLSWFCKALSVGFKCRSLTGGRKRAQET